MSSRFAVSTHLLSVVAYHDPSPVSSSNLAKSTNTSPGVIRQLTMRLNDAGLLRSKRGKTGGSMLARSPAEISLVDVYDAVEDAELLACNPNEPYQKCVVGRAINPVLDAVIHRADAAFRRELAETTLADVLAETLDD